MTDRFWAWPEGQPGELRRFGFTMAGALVLAGGWWWYRGGQPGGVVLVVVGAALAVVAASAPSLLAGPYGVWMYLARMLGWLNTHLLLGLAFFTLFALVGLVMRLVGYDPLRRRWEPGRTSYWQGRKEPLRPRDHFERQF